jgi:hypothetical protein
MLSKLITAKRTGRATNLLKMAPVLLFMLILSVSFANSTFAGWDRQSAPNDTLQGEVVAVDNLHNMSMLTLQSQKIGQFPNDQINIFMNNDTAVKICNARKPEKDIAVDRNATITYHEVQGLPLADRVTEKC